MGWVERLDGYVKYRVPLQCVQTTIYPSTLQPPTRPTVWTKRAGLKTFLKHNSCLFLTQHKILTKLRFFTFTTSEFEPV